MQKIFVGKCTEMRLDGWSARMLCLGCCEVADLKNSKFNAKTFGR